MADDKHVVIVGAGFMGLYQVAMAGLSPAEILDEIATLDAEAAEVLDGIRELLGNSRG